jgi:hypothetical protein
MSRIEVAGDICLRRQRPTQGSRADDGDDDEDDDDDDIFLISGCGLETTNFLTIDKENMTSR